jgi:hypothetical protein
MTTADVTIAQTVGQLIEGQRQLEKRLDILDTKVDKLLWVGFGTIGAVLAAVVTGVATSVVLS